MLFRSKHGTFTNTERRIQRVRPTADPPGSARQDWEITRALARRLGYKWDYDHPREVMDEISELAPIYGGVSYERLERGEEHGLQWPCPDEDHPGTLFIPMHFAAGAVNELTQETFDPTAGIPEYKVTSVRIEALGPETDETVLKTPDAGAADD